MALDLTEYEKPVHRPRRDEKPKISPKEDLQSRIKGLEEAKAYPDMSKADIAALDRTIAKLKEKLNN